MQSNFNFVTDGSKVYHLGGNGWYAVEQDEDKVMLVDTDCEVGDEELWTPWSDGDWDGEYNQNGQCILDYVNRFADKYFNTIKYAIEPRTITAGTYKLEDAYMWPMSYEEFMNHKVIGGKIVKNTEGIVWTRTFADVSSNLCNRHAWIVGSFMGDLYNNSDIYRLHPVAPSFILKKSSIDYISDDGEIILKPENNSEKIQTCEWIKYDYRTICPKNHDANNPYWRIPKDMDKLKYCPYCGKEIVVN